MLLRFRVRTHTHIHSFLHFPLCVRCDRPRLAPRVSPRAYVPRLLCRRAIIARDTKEAVDLIIARNPRAVMLLMVLLLLLLLVVLPLPIEEHSRGHDQDRQRYERQDEDEPMARLHQNGDDRLDSTQKRKSKSVQVDGCRCAVRGKDS